MVSIAIANGKGGVGKTSLSVSLAISLAEHGHKTLLVDADMGLANVDLVLGIKPEKTLVHVVRDSVPVSETVVEGPEGVDVVCGGTGSKELANLGGEELKALVDAVLDAGSKHAYVVLDTSSGIGESAMAFLRASKRVLVVTTPDPTSVMDAYATAKAVFEEKPGAEVALIVNMAESPSQASTVYGRVSSIVAQFLNKEIALAGIVPLDPEVGKALRSRQAFILTSPKCKASRAIDSLVEWLNREPAPAVDSPAVGILQRMRSIFAAFKKSEQAVEETPAVQEAA